MIKGKLFDQPVQELGLLNKEDASKPLFGQGAGQHMKRERGREGESESSAHATHSFSHGVITLFAVSTLFALLSWLFIALLLGVQPEQQRN